MCGICQINRFKKLGKDYRAVLGYMPQQQGLYDDFTLNRFLWYMAALKGLKKKEAKEKITQLLETVNLTDAAHKKLGSVILAELFDILTAVNHLSAVGIEVVGDNVHQRGLACSVRSEQAVYSRS